MGETNIFCAECSGEPTGVAELGAHPPATRCAKCGQQLVTADLTIVGAPPADSHDQSAPKGKCPYCLAGFRVGEEIASCPKCQACYHSECWQENGGCAVYGCCEVPATQGRSAIEVPFSYWGQENKPCPSCNQQILAAAKRCRHCGATFTSARPQGTDEFHSRAALEERLPAARRRVVTIFIFSIVPFLAPFGAVWGPFWSRRHREELAALPALYPALVKVGSIAALVQTIALGVMTLVYFFIA
jgi:hypothetical protein